MCFSAPMDLVAGGAIAVVAIDAWRHVERPAERLLAALPAVFAVHQLIEAGLWWALQAEPRHELWRPLAGLYLLVAFGLLPVLVPLAVAALEPPPHRRRMTVFGTIGLVVAVLLTYPLRGPISADIEGRHISYAINAWYARPVVGVYVVATCGALLASSRRVLHWYGVGNLVVVTGLALLDAHSLISLWCLWAALTSVLVAVELRVRRRDRGRSGGDARPAGTAPAGTSPARRA